MRKTTLLLTVAVATLLVAGCAGPERKLGRGLSNCCELVRWGELRNSIEQDAVLGEPGSGYYGMIHGFDRSLQRTSLGIFEVATFPIPLSQSVPYYGPIMTDSFSADPVYPESYKPDRLSNPLFDTDTYTGLSGGDVAPFIPGSRFQVFDN